MRPRGLLGRSDTDKAKAGRRTPPVAESRWEASGDRSAPSNDHSIHYADLPDVREIFEGGRVKKAADLLVEMDALDMSIEIAQARIDEIKRELEKMQEAAGTKGIRSENLAFAARECPGRRTLNKNMLMDNGVPLHVIKSSYVQGKPYMERNFKRV